ncbi:hypothetical protein LY76DRAFT_587156 [Colletotrichum caudatum]|nr:hypothetical protein LY76DRAFT_587156 [Colletotrichum caudatum]
MVDPIYVSFPRCFPLYVLTGPMLSVATRHRRETGRDMASHTREHWYTACIRLNLTAQIDVLHIRTHQG